ncbi:MAG: GGDEF domain-containing protein [Dehalococcoidia bacterium]|nr:GGDEF domain-containing protein [Dehalococcoidia bacterium]
MVSTRFPAYLRIIGTNAAAPVVDRRTVANPGTATTGERYTTDKFGLMPREALIERLAIVGDLAPDSPLSFVVVKVFGLGDLNHELGWRACETVLGAVAAELRELIRATDVIGRMSGSTFGVVLQGTGATAAAAVEARLNYRLNRLPGLLRPASVVVSAATGTGINADALPVAAMDSFDEDAV